MSSPARESTLMSSFISSTVSLTNWCPTGQYKCRSFRRRGS